MITYQACLLTEAEMAAGPTSWFGYRDPFFEASEAEQKRSGSRAADHGDLAQLGTCSYVLVLHKNESVELETAVSVMLQAGIDAATALRLVTTVNQRGRGIVVQGKEEDMELMEGMFADVGMKTTVQEAPKQIFSDGSWRQSDL